jgi:serine protease Do
MRIGEVPFYLIVIFAIAWWSFDENDGLRTPRHDQPVPPPIEAGPSGDALPAPSYMDPRVEVENSGPIKNSTGTAFSVDERGLWITARHVVDGCRRLGFVIPGTNVLRKSKNVWIHPNSDMALVEGPPAGAAVQLTRTPAGQGEHAFHVGYPRGKPGDVMTQVIGRARMISRGRYRINEPVVAYAEIERHPKFSGSLGGISGGPIFNSAGQVIGVTVAGNPRRGRVTGTAPRSFEPLFEHANKRPYANKITQPKFGRSNLVDHGNRLRRKLVVAQLLCFAK